MPKESLQDKVYKYFTQRTLVFGNVNYLPISFKANKNFGQISKNKLANTDYASLDTQISIIPKTDVPKSTMKQEVPLKDKFMNSTNDDAIVKSNYTSNTIIASNSFAQSVDLKWKDSTTIDMLYENIHNCMKCPLGETRKKFVFGTGNHNADIVIIGEAPGADEDEQGLPFVGRAGQLLTKILSAINLSREEVFICNILKCRPPSNRVPEKEETEKCEPYLHKQLELIKPKIILALGLTAINTLFKQKYKMSDIRGSVMNYRGVDLIPTYHPAALLRNPNLKKATWEDVQKLRDIYLDSIK